MISVIPWMISVLLLICSSNTFSFAAEKVDYLKTDWSFKGLFGKFDRASLQRGYQVYTEVCASCHSMKYLSYRNLYHADADFAQLKAQRLSQLSSTPHSQKSAHDNA